jgi:AcrR family transcriptional regulator
MGLKPAITATDTKSLLLHRVFFTPQIRELMSTTKEKIRAAAVRCFNRDGLANVRLQHIADEAAYMSVGNMAYHYRTKEHIVRAIWEELVAKQKTLLAEYRVVPLFEDIERQIRSTFQLQQEYLFFYLDTLEILRAYPDIAEAHRQHIQWQVMQVEGMLRFNISRGVFVAEKMEGQLTHLAQHYWMSGDTWLYRQKLLDAPLQDAENFRDTLWHILLPYCTEMGLLEFSQLNALILGNYF